MKFTNIILAALSLVACKGLPQKQPLPQQQDSAAVAANHTEFTSSVEGQRIILLYFEDSHIILGGPETSDTLDLSTDADHPLQSTILDDAGKTIGRLLVHELPDQNPKTHIEIWIDCGAGVPAPLCDRAITFQ